jgi:hypothetical protein
MTALEERPSITCVAYTKARRHPHVVGVIGGKVMPWPSTNTQLGAFIGVALFLLKFRPIWGAILPIPLQLITIISLPCLAWWGVRYWHPDDRSPARYAAGVAMYAMRPKGGRVNGKALRLGRPRAVPALFFCAGASNPSAGAR